MRQHVMKEFDKNNDRMISFQEFELGVNGTEAKNEQGWQVMRTSFFIPSIDYSLFMFSHLKTVRFTRMWSFRNSRKN